MDQRLEIDPSIVIRTRAGSGLYGRVWEGEQAGRKVAVKVIHPEMRQVASALQHFKALARVDGHANVVKVFAVARVTTPEDLNLLRR